jgi:hypothetical protein
MVPDVYHVLNAFVKNNINSSLYNRTKLFLSKIDPSNNLLNVLPLSSNTTSIEFLVCTVVLGIQPI